ncbi:MAG: hypothetical protein NT166_14180 [Candidatus Aminicenantes bacterium]|nr:hypothetical protein [Candidatus Aminicenantes bacterium]
MQRKIIYPTRRAAIPRYWGQLQQWYYIQKVFTEYLAIISSRVTK